MKNSNESLHNIAQKRIDAGDLSLRIYPKDGLPALAVRVNPDFGDDRKGTESAHYWPERNARCLCWQSKKHGVCSHTVAVELYQGRLISAQERRATYLEMVAAATAEQELRDPSIGQRRRAAKAEQERLFAQALRAKETPADQRRREMKRQRAAVLRSDRRYR